MNEILNGSYHWDGIKSSSIQLVHEMHHGLVVSPSAQLLRHGIHDLIEVIQERHEDTLNKHQDLIIRVIRNL